MDGRRVEGVMRSSKGDGVGDDESLTGRDLCGKSLGLGVVSKEERKACSSASELSF